MLHRLYAEQVTGRGAGLRRVNDGVNAAQCVFSVFYLSLHVQYQYNNNYLA